MSEEKFVEWVCTNCREKVFMRVLSFEVRPSNYPHLDESYTTAKCPLCGYENIRVVLSAEPVFYSKQDIEQELRKQAIDYKYWCPLCEKTVTREHFEKHTKEELLEILLTKLNEVEGTMSDW